MEESHTLDLHPNGTGSPVHLNCFVYERPTRAVIDECYGRDSPPRLKDGAQSDGNFEVYHVKQKRLRFKLSLRVFQSNENTLHSPAKTLEEQLAVPRLLKL